MTYNHKNETFFVGKINYSVKYLVDILQLHNNFNRSTGYSNIHNLRMSMITMSRYYTNSYLQDLGLLTYNTKEGFRITFKGLWVYHCILERKVCDMSILYHFFKEIV